MGNEEADEGETVPKFVNQHKLLHERLNNFPLKPLQKLGPRPADNMAQIRKQLLQTLLVLSCPERRWSYASQLEVFHLVTIFILCIEFLCDDNVQAPCVTFDRKPKSRPGHVPAMFGAFEKLSGSPGA